MKRQADDLAKNLEDVILVIKALLELNVLVPEGMRQEVLTTTFGAAFKKPEIVRSASSHAR